MAVESSWIDLFPERLVTGETSILVARTIYLVSTLKRLQAECLRKVKITSSHHAEFYKVGCISLDSESAKEIQRCKSELISKNFRSMDYFLKFESMKLELLVIVDHNATVNRKSSVNTSLIKG